MKSKGLSGYNLKLIAIITMFIDHVGTCIIEKLYQNSTSIFSLNGEKLLFLEEIFRLVGRLSFPIFCFLLVEGYYHTKNIKKYMTRLFIFALISEIPFDLALFHKFFYWGHQNVMFSLLLGLITIYLFDDDNNIFFRIIKNVRFFRIAVIPASCIIGEALKLDYGAGGICTIFFMYIFLNEKGNFHWKHRDYIFSFFIGTIILACCQGLSELAALIDMAFIKNYNGERGKSLKYFFYIFYPIHFIILYGIYIIFR